MVRSYHSKGIAYWLFAVAALAGLMVVFGGLVRLTGSGLSIVEWKLVTGTIPPLSEAAWQDAFGEYQQSPEFKIVNSHMTLAGFKFIYAMEYGHRLLGRILGLLYFIPLFIFWRRQMIPRERLWGLLAIGGLLVFQGVFGWYMVKSGLVDMPRVSHFRLTGHLLLALAFLALCLWTALRWWPPAAAHRGYAASPGTRRLLWMLFAFLSLQIALGGMVAGLRAGVVSTTFPLMAGRFFPEYAFSMQPWAVNVVNNPVLLHFVHRWSAFLVAALAIWAYWRLRASAAPRRLQRVMLFFLVLLGLQVALGISTIMLQVPVSLASLHQALALALFVTLLFVLQPLLSAAAAGSTAGKK